MTSNRKSSREAPADFRGTVPDELTRMPVSARRVASTKVSVARGRFKMPYHLGTGKPFVHRTS